MSRAIKYRAWDETHKEWVDYGFCLRFDADGNCQILNAFGQPFADRRTLVPVEWTGLKDKHGRDIYEGDIVVTENEQVEDYPVEEQYRGVVTYGEGKSAFYIKQPHDTYTPLLHNYTIKSMEVIGNIYQNPELLEKRG